VVTVTEAAVGLARTSEEIRAEMARATELWAEALADAEECRARSDTFYAQLYQNRAAQLEAHIAV
jgi:hypothetical protein